MTKPTDITVSDFRKADAPVLDVIINRWSPRAMSGESLTDEERASLFEAVRWTPSCFNSQPWRFLYALPGTAHWDSFHGLLTESNQAWTARAGMLLALLSRTRFEQNDQLADTYSFDAGAAWQSLAIQGTSMGLVVHAMRGFDKTQARDRLGVPELYSVEVMIAVGHPGAIAELPERRIDQEKPSTRRPSSEFALEGPFGF